MDDITRESVDELVELTRIECSNEEREELAVNLKKVMEFINHLEEVDTSSVEQVIYPFCDLKLKTREDVVGPTLDQKDFLETNAPSYIGGLVRVPPIGIK